MQRKIFLATLLTLSLILPVQSSLAEMEWQTTKQFNLPDIPLDMEFSKDGQWLYLLTEKGQLLVYDRMGEFRGNIEVDQGFDALEPGPYGTEVYLLSSTSKRVQVIEITHSHNIDINQSPYKGTADAPVVIVEYTDFQCPYCAKLVDIYEELMKTYPQKLKIVYKSFPLSNHKYAYRAATVAMAAHRKGRFWEFHDRLFEHHKDLDDDKIDALRKEFGFDTSEFNALIADPQIRAQVARDRSQGQRMGVRGTPTVFINGKQLKDKRLEGFKAAIDKELKKQQE